MCSDLNILFLGSLPLDPRLARCCDEGKDYVTELPDSPAVKTLNQIVTSKILKLPKKTNIVCLPCLQILWQNVRRCKMKMIPKTYLQCKGYNTAKLF